MCCTAVKHRPFPSAAATVTARTLCSVRLSAALHCLARASNTRMLGAAQACTDRITAVGYCCCAATAAAGVVAAGSSSGLGRLCCVLPVACRLLGCCEVRSALHSLLPHARQQRTRARMCSCQPLRVPPLHMGLQCKPAAHKRTKQAAPSHDSAADAVAWRKTTLAASEQPQQPLRCSIVAFVSTVRLKPYLLQN